MLNSHCMYLLRARYALRMSGYRNRFPQKERNVFSSILLHIFLLILYLRVFRLHWQTDMTRAGLRLLQLWAASLPCCVISSEARHLAKGSGHIVVHKKIKIRPLQIRICTRDFFVVYGYTLFCYPVCFVYCVCCKGRCTAVKG